MTGGGPVLELGHVFCLVPPDGDWADRLTAAGWPLDAGTVHEGQGTRNRRLAWEGRYLEPVWVHRDSKEAPERPLVVVLEVGATRGTARGRDTAGRPGGSGQLLEVGLRGPAPARLPPFDGPRVDQVDGAPGLERVATGGRPVQVTDLLRITG